MIIYLHVGPYSTEVNLVFGGEGSYTGDFERLMKEGSLLGNSKQSSEMGVYFHRGPTFGEHGWAFLY